LKESQLLLLFNVQNGDELWAESPFQCLVSMQKAMFTFSPHKNNIYEWSGGQLRVNTSLFVW